MQVNVIIHSEDEVFAIRGMAIAGVNGAWSESRAAGVIEYIRGLGFNYLQIGIHDTMESPSSDEVLIDRCEHPWFMRLEQNVALIDMAHEYGLGVMISPAMGCIIDGQWYEFYNISPSDPAEWFESYQRYALFYAQLAQEHDVEILNIGGGTDQFNTFPEEWGELVDEIRTVYAGRLAFSWFNFPPWPGSDPPFPHVEKLDILVNAFNWNGSGISFTGTRTGHNHPAIPEMIEWFNLELGRYVDGLQSQYGKPIIATDIYPWSVDGMNIDPAGLYWVDVRPIDNQEPVDYAEAAFRVMAARESQGVFFWSLSVGPPREGQPDIRVRPIEQMIKIWFSPASDLEE